MKVRIKNAAEDSNTVEMDMTEAQYFFLLGVAAALNEGGYQLTPELTVEKVENGK